MLVNNDPGPSTTISASLIALTTLRAAWTAFSPLLSVVTSQVTAPALIIVGVLMAQSLKEIKWHEMEIAIPSFLILLGMPLTYSISDGIALGFIFYPITMIAAKRGKEVSPIMYVLFFVFIGFMWILNV